VTTNIQLNMGKLSRNLYKVSMKIEHCWLSKVCKEYSLIAEVLKMYNDDKDREYMWEEVILYLLKDFDNPEIYDKIISYIRVNEQIEDLRIINIGKGEIHILVRLRKCPVYQLLDRTVIYYTKETAASNGRLYIKIRARRRSQIEKVMNKIVKKNKDIEVLNITRIKGDEEPTILQDRVIRMAWLLGYYEIPKKITIKEMSDMLDITPATLHEILKRAERKIIGKYVKNI